MTIRGKILGVDGDQILIRMLSGEAAKIRPGKTCDIEIRERGRSLAQNNFYHLFVTRALPYYRQYDPSMGHDELHLYFRECFLSYYRNVAGTDRKFARSTTELSVSEFCDFFENCMRQAAEDVFMPVSEFMDEYEEIKAMREAA